MTIVCVFKKQSAVGYMIVRGSAFFNDRILWMLNSCIPRLLEPDMSIHFNQTLCSDLHTSVAMFSSFSINVSCVLRRFQFSISSILCGRFRPSVSGRTSTSDATPSAIVPNTKPGNHGMIRI